LTRFTLTTAGHLATGDRFYFLSDKKKTVHQVNGKGIIKGKYFRSGVCYDETTVRIKNNKAITFKKHCLKDTKVVFLRHNETYTEESTLIRL